MLTLEQDMDAREWALTEDEARALEAHEQYFAAGFLRGDGVSVAMRHARGIASLAAAKAAERRAFEKTRAGRGLSLSLWGRRCHPNGKAEPRGLYPPARGQSPFGDSP